MSISEYLINSRQLTTLSSLNNELHLQNSKNYLFDLAYLSSLAIKGERAAEFLQGQLSCDIREVTPDTMRQGAMCNLKGRVLALLDVIKWQDFQLILPSDLMAETQNSLTKTAMLSRVQLEATTSYRFFGFYFTNPSDLLPFHLELPTKQFAVMSLNKGFCYHLGSNFYVIIIEKEQVEKLTQSFINTQQMRGSLAWHQLQLRNKRVQIYPETRGLFLPHRIDLHLSGYLNFDKGCYKGQEIVARTHYRAKLKHRLEIYDIETNESLLSGQKLFDLSGKTEVGELIDYCPLENNHYLAAASILLEHPNEVLIETHKNPVLLSVPNCFF